MTKLSAEACAIVEGRHSIPFLSRPPYRGRQDRGARVPRLRTSRRSASTAKPRRFAHSRRGLFAGALPNGSKRYQLRARFGDTVATLEDPYRFRAVP